MCKARASGSSVRKRCAWAYHHQGLNQRKKRLPGVGLTLMNLVVPLSVMDSDGVVQLVVVRSEFWCNSNPVVEDGHETITNIFERVMLREARPSLSQKNKQGRMNPALS